MPGTSSEPELEWLWWQNLVKHMGMGGTTQRLAQICLPPFVPSAAERGENGTFPCRQMVAFFNSLFLRKPLFKILNGISP